MTARLHPKVAARRRCKNLTFLAKNSANRKNMFGLDLVYKGMGNMEAPIPSEILDRLNTFGELLRYLRRQSWPDPDAAFHRVGLQRCSRSPSG